MDAKNLTAGKYASSPRDKIGNAYEQLASGDDYKKNSRNLRAIQICVVTVSCAATGVVNSLAHVQRLGIPIAIGLAFLVTGFVEGFYFTLRHGLTTTYKSGKQRFYALLCYRAIQATMILNTALLCCYIVGFDVPPWLTLWNHYSILCHFALALLGVSAVRDSDAVIENRMLELKASTGRQDIITMRKSAAIGSPLTLISAWVRGQFDALALSFRVLFGGRGSTKKYMEQ